jgi:hypothetical protein
MKYPKCDPIALGLGIGIIAAAYAFFLGLAVMWFDWGTDILNGLSSLYIGYNATFIGSLIGALWAFVDGFIAGAVIAWLYNIFKK